MPNIIPERMRLFEVYINGSRESGIAEGEFPNLEYMTSEVKGTGIAGAAETIVPGLFSSITFTLKWRTTPKNFYSLAEPRVHDLDLYADLEVFDAGLGQTKTQQLHAYIKAQTKHFNIGSLTVGESMDGETEHEVIYIKVEWDGQERIELDKYNYIYKVNGTDYLADSRRALGLQ